MNTLSVEKHQCARLANEGTNSATTTSASPGIDEALSRTHNLAATDAGKNMLCLRHNDGISTIFSLYLS